MQRIRSTDLPRYLHQGYVIAKCERDWDARGFPNGISSQIGPKVWWEVHRYQVMGGTVETFNTRREAQTWVEAQ